MAGWDCIDNKRQVWDGSIELAKITDMDANSGKTVLTTKNYVDTFFFNPSNYAFFYDDFTGNSTTAGQATWTSVATGTSAAVTNVVGQPNHPGVRRFTTGTTATGVAGLNQRVTFIDPTGGDTFITDVFLSAVTGVVLRIGLQDTVSTADNVDGYYFEFDPTGTSPNWRICVANNSSYTKTTTSTAVNVSTWYKLELRVNKGNTSVDFFVNDINVGTITTNLPVAGRQFGITGMFSNDGVATASVDCDVDYFFWKNTELVR